MKTERSGGQPTRFRAQQVTLTCTGRTRPGRRLHQRGAATLIIVMLLLFVVSLTAAYTGRNLILEQRMSTNQYRSAQAQEAADAGLEWAAAMLNGGRIDGDCAPAPGTTEDTFRARYLTIDAVTGDVRRVPRTGSTAFRWAACVFDPGTNDWACKCPTDDDPVLSAPGDSATLAFAVRFADQVERPGLIRVEVNGCNSTDLTCLVAIRNEIGGAAVCRSTACALLALHAAVRVPPVAALTARGTVDGTARLTAVNTDADAGGWTVRSGEPIALAPANFLPLTVPGTPPERSHSSLIGGGPGDLALSALGPHTEDCAPCLFSALTAVRPQTYNLQPAVRELDCTTGCTAADVEAARDGLDAQLLWLRGAGGLLADAGSTVGAAGTALFLAIDGPLTTEAGATVHAVVHAGAAALGGGVVNGAVLSANGVSVTADTELRFDADAVRRLHLASGSFVRLPGTWRDIP